MGGFGRGGNSYAAHPMEFSTEFDDFELFRAENDPQGALSLSNFDDGAAQIATGGSWTYDWQGAPDSVFEILWNQRLRRLAYPS